MIDNQDTPLGVRDYADVLRRNVWLILGLVALCVAAAALFTLTQTKTYSAQATVVIRSAGNDQLFAQVSLEPRHTRRDLIAELSFARSDEFTAKADAAAEVSFPVSVTGDEDTGILTFAVESLNAERSRDIANAWAEVYVELRSRIEATDILDLRRKIQNEIDSKDIELAAARAPIEEINARLRLLEPGTVPYNAANADRTATSLSLAPQINTINNEIRILVVERAELNLLLTAAGTPELTARINRLATLPTGPNPNGLLRNLALAAAAALVTAVTIALMRESARDRILTADELQAITGSSVLTSVPKVRQQMLQPGVDRHARPPYLTESLQRLVSSTLYAADKKGARSIVVTSAVAGEGKTTIASNLAVHIGRQGDRVLLIGADMRRPSLNEMLGYDSVGGLADYLEASEELREVVVPVVELENVSMLTSGTPTRNPAELLRSDGFNNLLTTALADYDYVIIDAPPLLPVIDAVEICQCVDAAVLVGRVDTATEAQLTQSIELIEASGAELLGVVLNASKPRDLAIDNYYTNEAEEDRRNRLRDARLERRSGYAENAEPDESAAMPVLAPVPLTEAEVDTSTKRSWRRKSKKNAADAQDADAQGADGQDTEVDSDDSDDEDQGKSASA